LLRVYEYGSDEYEYEYRVLHLWFRHNLGINECSNLLVFNTLLAWAEVEPVAYNTNIPNLSVGVH